VLNLDKINPEKSQMISVCSHSRTHRTKGKEVIMKIANAFFLCLLVFLLWYHVETLFSARCWIKRLLLPWRSYLLLEVKSQITVESWPTGTRLT